ncbi:hypothetical protein [Halogeometricum limi]|uniref:Uncharacterized protein n=1 Tax=Halogeometricum limi TaxID=555875 RepID=A0A1I6FWI8_9EURY|nr:hypothetical protein [Halogeometricum limi]SFR34256.1 hypothetical protein SAMN04488124_0430 [Halogeometricum limi]
METLSSDHLADTIDYRSIKRGLQSVNSSLDDSIPDETLREEILTGDWDLGREKFADWLASVDEILQTYIIQQLVFKKKRFLLEDEIGDKTRYISESLADASSVLANELDLNSVAYYESFFNFSERTTSVHRIAEMGGIFQQIRDDADTVQEAREIFLQGVESDDRIPEHYRYAVNSLSPIIGDVQYEPKPRLVSFEDEDHIYMEFWKVGEEITQFDVNRSDYTTIQTRSRTAVRIHLDTGFIEYASDQSSKDVRGTVLDKLMYHFAGDESEMVTDGGVSLGKQRHDVITVTDSDIDKINERIGVMSTLDTFHGKYTNTSLHSIDDRPTQQDDLHRQLRMRGYIKSHPKILLGVDGQNYELIKPSEVEDDYSFEDDVPKIEDLVDQIQRKSSYTKIEKVTVVLNADQDTIRIWKSAIPPEVRRMLFHMIAEELDW